MVVCFEWVYYFLYVFEWSHRVRRLLKRDCCARKSLWCHSVFICRDHCCWRKVTLPRIWEITEDRIYLVNICACCLLFRRRERDQLIAVLLQTFIAAADRGEKYLTLPLLLQIWKSTLCGEELSSVPDLKRHLRIRQLLPRKVAQTSVVILCMRNRGRNHWLPRFAWRNCWSIVKQSRCAGVVWRGDPRIKVNKPLYIPDLLGCLQICCNLEGRGTWKCRPRTYSLICNQSHPDLHRGRVLDPKNSALSEVQAGHPWFKS